MRQVEPEVTIRIWGGDTYSSEKEQNRLHHSTELSAAVISARMRLSSIFSEA